MRNHKPRPALKGAVIISNEQYIIERGWVDTAGKTRTWRLKRHNGEKIAEVTTLTEAETLLTLLVSQ